MTQTMIISLQTCLRIFVMFCCYCYYSYIRVCYNDLIVLSDLLFCRTLSFRYFFPKQVTIHHYRSCREEWTRFTTEDIPRQLKNNANMFKKNGEVDAKPIGICDHFTRVQSSSVLRLGNAIRRNVRLSRKLIGV